MQLLDLFFELVSSAGDGLGLIDGQDAVGRQVVD
jgi:hypothetical protein